MNKKITRKGAAREVLYDNQRWRMLEQKRGAALEVMKAFEGSELECITHGSIARGDVSKASDVDVAFLRPIPSFRIETALESKSFEIHHRFIVQATPMSAPKGYLVLDPLENLTVSIPLVRFTNVEVEFYSFGGAISSKGLKSGDRVPGIDKRLMLIEPTKLGHVESSILGKEVEISSKLNISRKTVMERVRVLTRRDKVGRTGTLLKHELRPGESFEEVLKKLTARNLILRKLLLQRS